MLLLKYLLIVLGAAMFAMAAAITLNHYYLLFDFQRRSRNAPPEQPFTAARPRMDWALPRRLAALAIVPILLGLSIVVVPSGMGGVRISQISGTLPGTLYPGVHFIKPFLDSVTMYDIRDQVLTTASKDGAAPEKTSKDDQSPRASVFTVNSREGLNVGLAITVRYRLDARKLAYIHSNLPQPVEKELVPPVVASVFREVVPNYTVRELFASKREQVRREAADRITNKLAGDGLEVKEVMLRDIQLPPEYARGLEGLLLKEQQDEGLNFETSIKEKQVKIAELEAEADKVREVKRAEGDARVRVLQAKSEADSMQYTLPLKEKQIQQSRLEAEARKEATVKNAEAMAQAKVIDSKAEMERRNLLAESEAKRIRLVAAADTERMQGEAVLLKQNPLLINKIIAERLSDKLQIMMVPSNSRFFFNDVLKGTAQQMASQAQQEEDADSESGDDPPAVASGGHGRR
jgi:regulator of protease activity HflC (stomatin/prohibitin superfamily)